MVKTSSLLALLSIAVMQITVSCGTPAPPEQDQMVRLAKLVIDSTQLESYQAALKEEIEASVRLEPGVLTLSQYEDKMKQEVAYALGFMEVAQFNNFFKKNIGQASMKFKHQST